MLACSRVGKRPCYAAADKSVDNARWPCILLLGMLDDMCKQNALISRHAILTSTPSLPSQIRPASLLSSHRQPQTATHAKLSAAAFSLAPTVISITGLWDNR